MPAGEKDGLRQTRRVPGDASIDAPGNAGELHQQAGKTHPRLTTNQGIPVSDNQNYLRAFQRGPTLLEDFILRERITHFDHEDRHTLSCLAGAARQVARHLRHTKGALRSERR